VYKTADSLILVSTDRQSAFDRHLASVPFKGQVLNLTSNWWVSREGLMAEGGWGWPLEGCWSRGSYAVFRILEGTGRFLGGISLINLLHRVEVVLGKPNRPRLRALPPPLPPWYVLRQVVHADQGPDPEPHPGRAPPQRHRRQEVSELSADSSG
jgi:hypothetical protein